MSSVWWDGSIQEEACSEGMWGSWEFLSVFRVNFYYVYLLRENIVEYVHCNSFPSFPEIADVKNTEWKKASSIPVVEGVFLLV